MWSRRSAFAEAENALTTALRARRAAGAAVLDLTLSNPTQAELALPQSAIRAALATGLDGDYAPEPLGLTPARQAVSAHIAGLQARGQTGFAPVPAAQILLTASTSEAYALLFTLLCDPGDRVLAPQPSYPLFGFLAQFHDIVLDPWLSVYADGWHIDWGALTAAITPQTRAILAVSPNNPTGAVLTRTDLDRLAALCVQHRLALIVDEVFADTVRETGARAADDPPPLTTVAGHEACLTFSLGGLSKTCLQPHVKLAWTAVSGPPDDVRVALQRLELLADTYLSVATPIQRSLPALLHLAPLIQTVLRERLDGNLRVLREATRGTPVTVLPVGGGWSVLLQVPQPPDARDWPQRLLDDAGVLVQPGWFFDLPGDGWLVLSLLPRTDVFRQGVRSLLAVLASALAA